MMRTPNLLVISIFVSLHMPVTAQIRQSKDVLKFHRALQIVESLYVEDIDSYDLTEAAIKGMLRALDPHSSYLNKEEVEAMREPMEGNFDGIGISFNMLTDTIYVIDVIGGGPSQKVGLLPGDKIIKVNDSLVAGVNKSNRDIVKLLRGKKGTTVKVDVLRAGFPELIEFMIVRDKIPITSIDAAYMISPEIGYIKLNRFSATSADEVEVALSDLQKQGLKHLLLDLTDNGGGILQVANSIADLFLDKNRLVVYTEGEHQPRFELKTSGTDELKHGRLVVLVNEASASASEIVAGAIQDWDRGVIIGRRTFGKGLVQRLLPLPDETMLRLTVARYYTPSGRSIQKPYKPGEQESYNNDFYNRYNHGEMFVADSIHFPDSLKYKTLLRGRTVYGGGGIMPDSFVPLDTTKGTMLHVQLNGKSVIGRMAIRVVDGERDEILKKFPTIESFKEKYVLPSNMAQVLKDEAEQVEIEWKEGEFEQSKELIYLQLKALIARDLYGPSAFFAIINEENDIFQRGFQIIKEPELYNSFLLGCSND